MQRVDKLGQMGELVKVRPGYARNFLLPKGRAIRANAANLKRREEAERIGERVAGLTVTIIRQAGESGSLYGSVSARDIAEGAKAGGLTVNRNQVLLEQPIKMLGLTNVRVELHPEVHINVVVNVARSVEEAERQARGEEIVREEEPSLEDELRAEIGAAMDDRE